MTDHTAHIEECERAEGEALAKFSRIPKDADVDEIVSCYARYKRARESLTRARLHAYGVPCPVPECEDGHILLSVLDGTEFSPPELKTEYCDYCEGRGMVLPARADA